MTGCTKAVFLLVFCLLIGRGTAEAQSLGGDRSAQVGVNIGYSFIGYREETLVPLNRYLDTFSYRVNGFLERGNFVHSLNLGFFIGDHILESNPFHIIWEEPLEPGNQYYIYNQTEHTFIRSYGQYALDYALWGYFDFPGYLGGAIRGDLYYIETFNNYMFRNLTVLVSLNLHVIQQWIINLENSLALSLSFPIVGLGIRPNYIGTITPMHVGVTSLHNHLAVYSDLQYFYKINNLISFNAGLGFELSYIGFPQQRRDAVFRLSTGVVFAF